MSTVETTCENKSYTVGRQVEIHTIKMGNSTDQVRILYKIKSVRFDKILRTNLS